MKLATDAANIESRCNDPEHCNKVFCRSEEWCISVEIYTYNDGQSHIFIVESYMQYLCFYLCSHAPFSSNRECWLPCEMHVDSKLGGG